MMDSRPLLHANLMDLLVTMNFDFRNYLHLVIWILKATQKLTALILTRSNLLVDYDCFNCTFDFRILTSVGIYLIISSDLNLTYFLNLVDFDAYKIQCLEPMILLLVVVLNWIVTGHQAM